MWRRPARLATLFFLFTGWLALGAAAQTTTLRGFVTDATSEQSLQGATVALEDAAGTLSGVATDGDGYFILRRLDPGTYTLRISFIGYAPYEESLTLSGGVVQRNVALAPSEAGLDEVIVEAEADGSIAAVAAGLQRVQPAQITRVPMPGVSGDLAAYLQTVPGIVVQGDRGGQFFVRGGALDQNLALFEGLPIYMPFHIISFYSAFPDEVINEADLYTGGFGARYGTRVSSVVDVEARNGNKQDVSGAASVSPFLSSVRVEVPLVENQVSAIGLVRQSLITQVVPDLFGQKMPYEFGDRFGKVHAFFGGGHSLSAFGLYTFDQGDIAATEKSFEGDIQPSVPDDTSQVGWKNLLVGGRYSYLSSTLPFHLDLHGGRSWMENEIGQPDDPERRSEIESYDAAAHLTWFLRRGRELHLGHTYRRSTLSYTLGGLFQDLAENEETLTEHSSYAELEWPMAGGRINIWPGLHAYTLPDYKKTFLEPRLRATWQPTWFEDRLQFNLALGRYHQVLVGLNDERDIGNLFTAWVSVPEDDPTPRADHAILGVNVRVQPGLSFAAEGFYKTLENLSVPVFSAFPSFTTDLQQADGRAYGVDVRADFSDFVVDEDLALYLDGYLSLARSQVEYETETLTYTPSHDRRTQFNALLTLRREDLSFTVQFQFGSGLPYTSSAGFDKWLLLTPDTDVTQEVGLDRIAYNEPFAARLPDYERLDAWIERRIERGRYVTTLRAGAVNILNRENLFYFDLFTFKRIDQLPLIPSVGVKLEIR